MALVLFGAGIVGMSGSIAGNTFAKNRFGKYIRARTKPVNPRSGRQSAARTVIMFLAEQWREDPMDDAKRLAWENYAKGVNWKNKLGESVTLTGFNMFIRSNAALIRAGGDLVTDGPPDIGLPPGDPDFYARFGESGAELVIYFNDGFDWCKETGAYLSVEMGRPQNHTRNFFGGPWRWAGAVAGIDADALTSPQSIPTPFTIIEGQKIWTRARIIRKDARCSTQFETFHTATA